MKIFFLSALIACSLSGMAQDSTKVQAQSSNPLSFSCYLDTYYTYDFGNPGNHIRPGFIYSHNRHNEVNLNLGFVKAAYLFSICNRVDVSNTGMVNFKTSYVRQRTNSTTFS